jgi:hypothetical protein
MLGDDAVAVMRMVTKYASLLCFGLVALASTPCSAVVIRGGDGSGNATAPNDDPGWASVGMVNGGSGVYLGNGWVLTASHLWGSGVTSAYFNGASYSVQPGSEHRLHAPSSAAPVDLEMFRITSAPPGLSDLAVSQTAPAVGATVLGIGNGRNRAASETWWDGNWNQQTGTEAYRGFLNSSGNAKRWGENTVAQRNLPVDDGYGSTFVLKTYFDNNADPSEMQAAQGDSGGGLFYKNGDQWELAGIILAVNGPRTGQPDGTVLCGDATYIADLSRYRDQITAIAAAPGEVPEPSTLAMLGGLGLMWLVWRVRGRTARHRC